MAPELAQRLVAGLKEAGIDFFTYLPESRLSDIIPLIRNDPSFTMVATCHEGTAVTIACGAALVGKRAVVYCEATGFVLSMYNLQSMAMQFGLPIMFLISYTGSPGTRRTASPFRCGGDCWRRRSKPWDCSTGSWKTAMTLKHGWRIWRGRHNSRNYPPVCCSPVSSRPSRASCNAHKRRHYKPQRIEGGGMGHPRRNLSHQPVRRPGSQCQCENRGCAAGARTSGASGGFAGKYDHCHHRSGSGKAGVALEFTPEQRQLLCQIAA